MTTTERERAETHLRGLESLGFDVKGAWRELTTRVDAYELGTPGDLDLRYTCPATIPSINGHFVPGSGLRPTELSAHVLWTGYHYTLTPGQRKWFREFTGMTPAQTVTVAWLELWPGTLHPRAFKLVSDLHVDPRHRKHVITEWVVREPGSFFTTSTAFDNEVPAEKTLSLHVGDCKNWSSVHKWAVEDLAGVKLKGDVGISFVDNTSIHFTDESGRLAKVDRDEFLATVADYDRLHKDKPARKVKVASGGGMSEPLHFKSMEDMLADLEATIGTP